MSLEAICQNCFWFSSIGKCMHSKDMIDVMADNGCVETNAITHKQAFSPKVSKSYPLEKPLDNHNLAT